MILKNPVYYHIKKDSLIEYRGHLFKTLWATFPTYISKLDRTLENLYTHEQIEFFYEWALANRGFDNELELGALATALHDYMEAF